LIGDALYIAEMAKEMATRVLLLAIEDSKIHETVQSVMNLTLIGTGTPVPTVERAGTSLVIETNGDPILVDCGPKTVYRLMDAGINPGTIETLFFTHHHMDHNASFFHFVFASWAQGGRETLDIYGPDGTDSLLTALYEIYETDIEYRTEIYPSAGIENIDTHRVTDSFSLDADGWRVRAHPVDHSIETYAYRFDEHMTETSVVVSGDTRKIDSLAAFAKGADVLVQDACIAPFDEDRVPDDEFVWPEYAKGEDEGEHSTVAANHCTPEEAGEIAQEAGVEKLVLTHILPYRDLDAMRRRATSAFDGEVVIGQDGLTLQA
jgi:ribonuclease BN (tRNA processing enzyme)